MSVARLGSFDAYVGGKKYHIDGNEAGKVYIDDILVYEGPCQTLSMGGSRLTIDGVEVKVGVPWKESP